MIYMYILQFHPDKAIQRDSLRFIVLCAYVTDGCDWEGSLRDYVVTFIRILTRKHRPNIKFIIISLKHKF